MSDPNVTSYETKQADDAALFNRMAKVGQDQDVTLFDPTWGSEEGTGSVDTFGCLLVGRGHSIGLLGPRRDWKFTMTKVLDTWDEIKARAGE